MLVICLHRVPAFVVPLHCMVAPCPCALLAEELEEEIAGGLHILHGSNPSSRAFVMVISSETFFTVWQVPK